MKQFHILSISFFLVLNSSILSAQTLVSAEYLSTTSSSLLALLVSNQVPTSYDVDYYKIIYNTTDTQGNPTIASGGVGIPVGSCDTLPIVAYCHGTVLRKQDIPSEENFEAYIGKLFASAGYISVMPDYIGLGESSGLHPYVHAKSEATATLDLVRATREFLASENGVQDNNQLFITGYSQGGHAAMATYKYIQDNGLYTEFNVAAAAPASGPYNLSGSQAAVLTSGQPYSNPGYVVYLLMGYQVAYGTLYNSLSEVLKSPYDTAVLPYFDGVQDQYDMSDVNAILPQVLSDLMQDSTLNNFTTNPNHRLAVALRDNDNYDWTPGQPLRMFYCTGDEQVAYGNALVADSVMDSNGAPDVDAVQVGTGNHSDCVIPSLVAAYDFFETHKVECSYVQSVDNPVETANFKAYPNPAKEQITVNIQRPNGQLYLTNLQGQRVKQQTIYRSTSTLDISNLPAGIYFLEYNTGNDKVIQKVVVQ
tara:strand:- start:3344 stop:4777 length:1434 start_codon:yes stop_codon:yes gene_type:complete